MKLGFIISTIIAGLLWLSVMQVTNNIFLSSGRTNLKEHVKIKGEALADVMERDLNRLGYGVPGNGIVVADSTAISFNADFDNDGTIKNVTWFFTQMNPNERLAIRMIDSVYTDYMIGITDFRFGYKDRQNQETNNLAEITRIEMLLVNASTEGYDNKSERHAILRVINPVNIQLQNN